MDNLPFISIAIVLGIFILLSVFSKFKISKLFTEKYILLSNQFINWTARSFSEDLSKNILYVFLGIGITLTINLWSGGIAMIQINWLPSMVFILLMIGILIILSKLDNKMKNDRENSHKIFMIEIEKIIKGYEPNVGLINKEIRDYLTKLRKRTNNEQ